MNLYDKHRHALEAFKERLLGSSLRDRIARIVVFGSFVKGVVREDSDLDILVVTNDGDELSDFIADVTLEIQMRHKIGIEPVVVSIDEFFPVRSYFLSNVMRHGWEIYSMPPESLKEEERRNLIRLAEEYLSGARDAAKNEHWRLALDAAYNAAELAVKSLILKFDDDLPASHGGLIGRFSELYVQGGRCEKGLESRLNRALEKRSQARYSSRALVGDQEAGAVMELAALLKELAEQELQ